MRIDDALFQLGMDLEASTSLEPRSTTQTEDTLNNRSQTAAQVGEKNGLNPVNKLDFFIEENGEVFAGKHIIIDLYEAERLDDQAHIQATMLQCVETSGATLLHIHLHPFEPTGVSGVAVLAESHISVHTWPEAGYAAFDVFMCGETQPEKCIDILAKAFQANRVDVHEIKRGVKVAIQATSAA